MKIGCIGKGMVGGAIFKGLQEKGHIMSFYDPVYNESNFVDIIDTDCVFIAVPTLLNEKGECDLSILVKTLDNLNNKNYKGIICIKSTITPGTTQRMIDLYKNTNICFCPEFLKERSAYEDFVLNNPICIVGTESEDVFRIIREIHTSISKVFKMVKPIEAELTKYMQNVFNTYRIIFANGFYEVCKENNVEYNSVLNSLLERNELDAKYMKCSEDLRGPSGPCLVKDTIAFNTYVNSLNMNKKPEIFQTIINDMKIYPKTVIKGTRSEMEYFGKLLE